MVVATAARFVGGWGTVFFFSCTTKENLPVLILENQQIVHMRTHIDDIIQCESNIKIRHVGQSVFCVQAELSV